MYLTILLAYQSKDKKFMFECHNNMEYQNTNVTNNKTYYPRQIGRPNSKVYGQNIMKLILWKRLPTRHILLGISLSRLFFVMDLWQANALHLTTYIDNSRLQWIRSTLYWNTIFCLSRQNGACQMADLFTHNK